MWAKRRPIFRVIHHLETFVGGEDVSVEWAKNGEALLDDFDELDDVLEELQDRLAFYRPEGGPYLFDRDEMDRLCRRILPILRHQAMKSGMGG